MALSCLLLQPWSLSPFLPACRFDSRAGRGGVAVHFDDFHLPAGVQMWVTNEDGTWQEGPYDFRDNDGHGRLATGDVPGEVAVLRLTLPPGAAEQVHLHIEGAAGFVPRCRRRAREAVSLAKSMWHVQRL